MADYNGHSQYIWTFLMSKIGNEYGVSGLMGNLEAESGLCPYIVQGDVPPSQYSIDYTTKVDNGVISKHDFIYGQPPERGGYGLAQWTTYGRRKGLYEMKEKLSLSIGHIDVALEYLWYELTTSYKSVLKVLQNANDIKSASNEVLFHFEAPLDQSSSVQKYRYDLCRGWYNDYSGSYIPPDVIRPVPEPLPSDTIYKILMSNGYNMSIITQQQSELLKKIVIGDTCHLKHSFIKNKKIYGHNMYGQRVKSDNKKYIITSVLKNGCIALQYKNGNVKYIKPNYIKE